MKKSLFALAAFGAFAGAAQAQSSVTVYGILDVGYMSQFMRASGTPGNITPTASTAAGNNQGGGGAGTAGMNNSIYSQSSGFASSAQQSSRLGFRGTEDLGGGTRAFFTVEFGLAPTNSQSVGQLATGTNANALNNRQSFVGIGQKGLGAASIGTQYTPVHEAVAATDPGQANNMPGNLVYAADLSNNSTNASMPGSPAATNCNFNGVRTAAGAAGAANGTAAGTAQSCTLGGPGSGNVPYTIRAGNSLRLATDPIAGFVGKVFYSQINTDTNSTTAANNGATANGYNKTSGWGLGLDYTWNKLLVTGNFQSFKSNPYAQAALNAAGEQVSTLGVQGGTTWGVGGTQSATTNTEYYLAGTYDFGILRAYVQYLNRKVSSVFDSAVYTQRTAQQVGVRSFVTPKIESWASVSSGKLTNAYYVTNSNNGLLDGTTNSVGVGMSAYQLGTNYWMSKRTNLYAIYGVSKTANGVYATTSNGNVASINANSSFIGAYALGVRHTF